MSTNRIHWLCGTLSMSYFCVFLALQGRKTEMCLLIIFINIYSKCYVLKLFTFINFQYLFYVLIDSVRWRSLSFLSTNTTSQVSHLISFSMETFLLLVSFAHQTIRSDKEKGARIGWVRKRNTVFLSKLYK